LSSSHETDITSAEAGASAEIKGASVESALIRMKSSLSDGTKRPKLQTIEHEEPRNPMFDKLVEREDDTVGLLAYALYKQSKRDWLVAFLEMHGRAPTDAESRAFITGEQLPRRMLTYRQLAQQQLDGMPLLTTPAPQIATASEAPSTLQTKSVAAKTGFWPLNKATLRYLAIMTGLVIGMAIVFRLVAAWLFR
jgi:hypothetical protein